MMMQKYIQEFTLNTQIEKSQVLPFIDKQTYDYDIKQRHYREIWQLSVSYV